MRAFIGKVVAQRAAGDRPSAPRAVVVAAAAGAVAAGITYRALRS